MLVAILIISWKALQLKVVRARTDKMNCLTVQEGKTIIRDLPKAQNQTSPKGGLKGLIFIDCLWKLWLCCHWFFFHKSTHELKMFEAQNTPSSKSRLQWVQETRITHGLVQVDGQATFPYLVDKFHNHKLQDVSKRGHLVDAAAQVVECPVLHNISHFSGTLHLKGQRIRR